MKKLLLILFNLTILFGFSQEFAQTYFNAEICKGDSCNKFESVNSFLFNLDGNAVKLYANSGDEQKYIYLSEIEKLTTDTGDKYQKVKTINIESSTIWYFYIYKEHVFMFNAETDMLIGFY
jgi:hypothetical protein